MSFTQSELDEVLGELFKPDGIFELSSAAEVNHTGVLWRAFYRPHVAAPARHTTGNTPAEAIRKATVALVAARLMK